MRTRPTAAGPFYQNRQPMKKTIFKRASHKDNYTVLKVTALRDRELSWQAKGLHNYLLHLPDDWDINMVDLQKRATNGRDSLYNTVRELEAAGYFYKEIHRQAGKFAGITYYVFEEPAEKDTPPPFTGKPDTVKPDTGKPDTENPQLLSIHSTNYPHNQVSTAAERPPAPHTLEYYQEKIRGLDIVKDTVKNRLRVWEICRPYLKSNEFENAWELIAGRFASQVKAEELIKLWIIKADRWDQVKRLQLNKLGGWAMIHATKHIKDGKQQQRPQATNNESQSASDNEF